MSNETDLDWLARNVHKWPAGEHQLWCYVGYVGGILRASGDTLQFKMCRRIERNEWLSRRAELQNKPSWVSAPEWAQWVAQHESGYWAWGSGVPNITDHTWAAGAPGPQFIGKMQWSGCAGEVLGDWRDTLDRRPECGRTTTEVELVKELFEPFFQPFTSIEDNQEEIMKQDATWHERGELPPAGIECEARAKGDNWKRVRTIGIDNEGAMVVQFLDDAIPYHGSSDPRRFRPILSERDVLIEIIKGTDDMDDRIADAILAAGFSLRAK